ncbi:MAG: fibronectin type III domain-containing protein, partial [Acutalibacteraceae bacterium]
MKKINALLSLGGSLIILIILFSFGSLALGTDFATATQVKVNSPYSDNISGPGDENYYRFSLSTPGSFYLDFKHKNVYDDTELWNAILYNEKIEEIALYSFKGNEERTTTCVIGLDKGTYYLKIKGSNYIDLWENQQVVNTSVYTLTLKFSKSNSYEKENNDSFNTSTHITSESIFYGSLNDVWDCDYYDFTIKEKGNYHISFNHPCIFDYGNDEYFEVRIYNSTGQEIKYISSKGNIIKTDETIALEKGKYFLRIGGGYSYCGHLASQKYSNVTYNFGVVKTPSKVSNLKADSSTSAISLSWSKVSGVSGYQIYQYDSTKKKYVKIANVSSNIYKVSKLKSATTYKYAARAYKKVGSSYY